MSVPTDDELFDIIAREGQVDRARLSRALKLADADIASIEVISILFAVEDRWGVRLDETGFGESETMGDLIDRLKAPFLARG